MKGEHDRVVPSLLKLSGIWKSFGGVPALRDARLEVLAGEIHGLVGENGAGKSTLINIATGVLRPDSGVVHFAGRPITLANPRQAAAHGIAVVHQEADLFPQLSVAENMLLGRGLRRGPLGFINWRGTYRQAQQELAALGESFDVRDAAGGLSVARRMMAEIASAISEQARVLFLDEPTSALTLKEIENLFEQIRRLKRQGVGIVYVSHRIEEVLDLCDRVTILRDGANVVTQPTVALSMEEVVAGMVGRAVHLAPARARESAVEVSGQQAEERRELRPVRLEVVGATDGAGVFHEVTLTVHAGEIVGLYGFVGAGRSELGQALFGLRDLARGEVVVDGHAIPLGSPRRAMRAGLVYLPEDRLVQGVFRSHPVRANASVAMLRSLSAFGWVPATRERRVAEGVVRDMNVRARSIEQAMVTLSGGNQQKVVFGRWQVTNPKVFVLDEPTRGVDVGAKGEIHRLIGDMADRGAAVVLISSELPEILAMCDRVVTLSEGHVTGVFDPKLDSKESIAAAAVPRAAEAASAAQEGRSWPARLLQFRELALVGFIVMLCAVMAVARPGEFATFGNFLDVLASAAVPAMMAQGAMLIICAGGIDISVGSMMGLVGAMAAMAAKSGLPPSMCLALAVSLGCLLSLANGGTALVARIHPIIVTLAGISIYRGLMRIATGGDEVLQLPGGYRALAEGTILGVPKLCYYGVGVTILAHVLLRYTLVGRRVLALGNSANAARLIGLSQARLTLFVFAVSGCLVGLCSVLHAGYYAKVEAGMGAGMELRAIAAAVIGGANIMGGRGSAFGALLGAFLIALLPNVLIFARGSDYWQNLFVGGLILLAVVADALLEQRAGARARRRRRQEGR